MKTYKEYYQENKEKLRLRAKKYREDNKELINKKYKEYYAKNKKIENKRSREYYHNNILSISIIFSRLKSGAKARKIDFNIDDDFVSALIKNKCSYCGTFENISVDRVDSNIGYTKSNCVPCCNVCNIMKNCYSVSEFLVHVSKIYKNCVDLIAEPSYGYNIRDAKGD